MSPAIKAMYLHHVCVRREIQEKRHYVRVPKCVYLLLPRACVRESSSSSWARSTLGIRAMAGEGSRTPSRSPGRRRGSPSPIRRGRYSMRRGCREALVCGGPVLRRGQAAPRSKEDMLPGKLRHRRQGVRHPCGSRRQGVSPATMMW